MQPRPKSNVKPGAMIGGARWQGRLPSALDTYLQFAASNCIHFAACTVVPDRDNVSLGVMGWD
jgi:hypothetical protein